MDLRRTLTIKLMSKCLTLEREMGCSKTFFRRVLCSALCRCVIRRVVQMRIDFDGRSKGRSVRRGQMCSWMRGARAEETGKDSPLSPDERYIYMYVEEGERGRGSVEIHKKKEEERH